MAFEFPYSGKIGEEQPIPVEIIRKSQSSARKEEAFYPIAQAKKDTTFLSNGVDTKVVLAFNNLLRIGPLDSVGEEMGLRGPHILLYGPALAELITTLTEAAEELLLIESGAGSGKNKHYFDKTLMEDDEGGYRTRLYFSAIDHSLHLTREWKPSASR